MDPWVRLIVGTSHPRHRGGRTGRLLALPVTALLLTAACSSTGVSYDPVFTSVGTPRTSSGTCPSGSTCVEVPLTAVGEAAGETGECALYTTPGDPATMEPLVAEAVRVPETDAGELEIPLVWEVAIARSVEPRSLNPVCGPMVEG